jgi:sulfite reductase alpha subunit-like flavoprotein
MGFRSCEQQSEAIQTMLTMTHLPAFDGQVFFSGGQMLETFTQLCFSQSALSTSERVMTRIALDFWTWQGCTRLFDLNLLTTDLINLVVSLFLAVSQPGRGEAVDQWIASHKE